MPTVPYEFYTKDKVGAALDPVPYIVHNPGATNLCEHSHEFDNADWVKSNVTVTADSDAGPNAGTEADTLLATAGNATVLDTITNAETEVTFSIYLKRKTGTGDIDLTVDGGTGWTTKVITSSWARYDITQAAVTNPVIGIRIVTDTDAVYAWGAQCKESSFATPIVETSGSTATHNVDNTRYPYSTDVFNQDEGMLYGILQSNIAQTGYSATDQGGVSVADAVANLFYLNSGGFRSTDGTNNAVVDPTFTADTDYPFAVTWSAANGIRIGYKSGGSWTWDSSSAAYDGGFTAGSWINLFYTNSFIMQLHDLKIYDLDQGTAWIEANH